MSGACTTLLFGVLVGNTFFQYKLELCNAKICQMWAIIRFMASNRNTSDEKDNYYYWPSGNCRFVPVKINSFKIHLFHVGFYDSFECRIVTFYRWCSMVHSRCIYIATAQQLTMHVCIHIYGVVCSLSIEL